MTLINEVANQAARQTGDLVKAEMRLEMEQMKGDINRDIRDTLESLLKPHLGDMTAHEHLVQHERMERILDIIDSVVRRFWVKMLNTSLVASAIGVVMYAIVSASAPNLLQDHIRSDQQNENTIKETPVE